MSDKLIELNTIELAQLLDVAQFQLRCAQDKLRHHQDTEGPMADYNLEAYTKKADEFRSAVVFWGAVVQSCLAPREETKIRESEQFRAAEAVKARQHFYYGPDCIFCGCFGPIDADEPCFDPDPAKQLDKHQRQIEGLQDIIEKYRKDLAMKGCWRDCPCEPRRVETAEARVEVLKQAILLLKHRDVAGEPCFCFMWPDEEQVCEAEKGNEICKQVKEALKYPNGGYPMPLLEYFGKKSTIEYLEEQAKVDGPVFNCGRSEGQSDVAAQLRAILDPTDEQHLNLDGLLDIVRKLAP